jgi:hypothetical protein
VTKAGYAPLKEVTSNSLPLSAAASFGVTPLLTAASSDDC